MRNLYFFMLLGMVALGTMMSCNDKLETDQKESLEVILKSEILQEGENTEELKGEKGEKTAELQGEIVYPKYGKYYLLNILDDSFVEAAPVDADSREVEYTRNEDGFIETTVVGGGSGQPVEYALNAEVPAGAGLKIVVITKSEEPCHVWGGFYPSTIENWIYSGYDTLTRSNTFTVYESGKNANLTVTFIEDCIIEYYENGATTPTKVKEIKVMSDVTIERLQPNTEGLQGVITYPKYGKYYLLNILDDSFVEAAPVDADSREVEYTRNDDGSIETTVVGGGSGQPVEYSLFAEAPAGAGLKVVIITKNEDPRHVWGGFYPSSVENWIFTSYDIITRSNTFTVYESGKSAHLTLTFVEDCIIEYYENGATTPTKVKEINVSPDVTIERQQPNTEGLQGDITYPVKGKYNLPNILAEKFVEATAVGGGRPGQPIEYALNAEVPAGAGLKIVIKTKREDPHYAWGGFYPSSVENWIYTIYDIKTRSNTFTVYESGKSADLTVTFTDDCIIEYFENGAKTPTKVKEIKVKQ